MRGQQLTKFLIEHPDNWEELLSSPPYSLTIKKDHNYVLFKYSQIDSDFSEEIVREARGIILSYGNGTWRIVRLAFDKFFNVHEPYAAEINWNSVKITEKIDGSIMTLWWDKEWHLSTNATIDAYLTNIPNFGKLFDIAAKNTGLDISQLSTSYNYTFELVGPQNQIVLEYPETTLYHLSTRDMLTQDEVFVDIGVQKPQEYVANSLEEAEQIVAQMNKDHEGIVVRDAQENRIKIKTQTYFTAHRLARNGHITDEYLMELILANDTEEILSYFSSLRPRVDDLLCRQSKFNNTISTIQSAVKSLGMNKMDRKEFATYATKTDYPEIYFAAYDNKIQKFVHSLSPAKWLKYMKGEK